MVSIFNVGDKLDIKIQQHGENPDQTVVRMLKSVVYEKGEKNTLEIAMPTEGGKMVLLALGVRYELIFYAKNSMYSCVGVVRRRYKLGGHYLLSVEVKSKPQRIQRRAYYRHACTIDTKFVPVTEEETKILTPEEMLRHHQKAFPEEAMRIGTILDLSGGGIRMVTREPVETKQYILVNLELSNEIMNSDLWVLGSVLRAAPVADSREFVELRVEFVTEDDALREQIIRYIFEEERKHRKKSQGMTR